MEIINNRKKGKPYISAKKIYIGLVLVGAGAVWMLTNFDIIHFRFTWPVFMMLLGGFFLADRRYSLGIISLGIGLVFGVDQFLNLNLPIKPVLLPALVILAGLVILFDFRER